MVGTWLPLSMSRGEIWFEPHSALATMWGEGFRGQRQKPRWELSRHPGERERHFGPVGSVERRSGRGGQGQGWGHGGRRGKEAETSEKESKEEQPARWTGKDDVCASRGRLGGEECARAWEGEASPVS